MNLKERLNKIIAQKRAPSADEEKLINLQVENMKATLPLKNPTVLLIAPHMMHGELHPSIVKYFSELNYDIHLVILDEVCKLNSLSKCDFKNLKVFPFPKIPVNNDFFELLDNYKYIFIDTLFTHDGTYFINEFRKYYKKDNVFAIVHDVESENQDVQLDFLKNNHAFVLRNAIKYDGKEIPYITPSYFGKVVPTPKNKDKTVFFVVGGGNRKGLRNFELLFKSIDKLIDDKMDFVVNFIGVSYDKLEEYLKEKYRGYVNILGKLDFSSMYNELEKSDYILFNIDSSCIDYKKYLNGGITGSYSLTLGFYKPAIIDYELAESYNFIDKSVTYENNKLYEAMKEALLLDEVLYGRMQMGLKELNEDLYNNSLMNFRKVLDD